MTPLAAMLWPWALAAAVGGLAALYVALLVESLEDVWLAAFLLCIGGLAIGLAIGLGVAEAVQ